ncbi:hypothetical protein CVT25_015179, partial [Psilocybe cyanescens]
MTDAADTTAQRTDTPDAYEGHHNVYKGYHSVYDGHHNDDNAYGRATSDTAILSPPFF